MRSHRLFWRLLFGLALFTTACNGSSVSGSNVSLPPTPTPTAAAGSASVPVAAAGTNANLTLAGGGKEAISFPAVAGAVPAGETVNVSASTTAPAGLPALSASIRAGAASGRARPLLTTYTPVLFTTVSGTPASVTFTEGPAFTATLAALNAGATYGLFMCSVTSCASWTAVPPTATPASGSITFPSSAGSFTLSPGGAVYALVLIQTTADTPTPSPSASASATASASASATASASSSASASPQLIASPSSLSVAAGALSQVTVSETGFTGTITAAVTGGTAAVSPLSATAVGGSATFTVGGLSAGNSTITFSDGNGHTVSTAAIVGMAPSGTTVLQLPTSTSGTSLSGDHFSAALALATGSGAIGVIAQNGSIGSLTPAPSFSGGATQIDVIQFTTLENSTFGSSSPSSQITFSLTVPSGYTNISEQFYLPSALGSALPGFSGGWNAIPIPCTAAGGNVYACTFPLNIPMGAQFGTFALPPGTTFGFLIAGVPPASLTASASTATFTASGQTQAVTVNETGYGGTFSVSSSNGAVASVTPASGVTNGGTFTITAGSTAGSATITITDSMSHSATVSVTNTLTSIQLTGKVHR